MTDKDLMTFQEYLRTYRANTKFADAALEATIAPILSYGGMGGSFGCLHTEIPFEEAVQICTESFGGSFQELFERLGRKGYSLVKKG